MHFPNKRADEPLIEVPKPYDGKQGWLKNQNNLSEPIWQVGPIFLSALVDIVNSAEQKREREVLIKLDDFDDCVEEKENADFSRTDDQATCLCDKKIKLLRLGYLWLIKLLKRFI